MTDDVDIDKLASRMRNFTGAEIAAVASEAIMLAIRDLVLSGEELDEATISAVRVDMKYFEKAMENVQPMSETELMKYERLTPNAMYR